MTQRLGMSGDSAGISIKQKKKVLYAMQTRYYHGQRESLSGWVTWTCIWQAYKKMLPRVKKRRHSLLRLNLS